MLLDAAADVAARRRCLLPPTVYAAIYVTPLAIDADAADAAACCAADAAAIAATLDVKVNNNIRLRCRRHYAADAASALMPPCRCF